MNLCWKLFYSFDTIYFITSKGIFKKHLASTCQEMMSECACAKCAKKIGRPLTRIMKCFSHFENEKNRLSTCLY